MVKDVIKLGDVATYINGYAFKPEDRGEVGLPIIRIQDLTGNAYDLGFYDGEYPEKIEINDGDVLISWSASLGVYVWSRGRALLNQHIFKVVFDKVDIDKNYFVYAVRQKLVEMGMKTHGATMKHIVKKDFDATLIPYPSLNEQAEIATNLNKVSRVIEARKQELQLLDDLIKARFVEMFGSINNNVHGFDIRTLQDVCEQIKDGTHQTPTYTEDIEKGFKFLSSKDVTSGKIDWSKIKYIPVDLHEELYARIKPQKGDILLAKNGTTGVAAVVETDDVFDIYVSLALLRPIDMNSVYLWAAINSAETKHQFDGSLKGIGVPNLHLGEIKKTKIIVPPIELQNEFEQFAKQVDKSKVVVQKSLDETQQLFDSLMQKYFG